MQRTRVVRVCTDAGYAPFAWLDADGHLRGLDICLGEGLARRWGMRPEFVVVHFDGLYDALLAARCDLIISAVPYDRTMTRDVAFSVSYFDDGQSIVPARNASDVKGLADLAGKVIGVELGSEGHLLVRDWNRYHARQISIRTLTDSGLLSTVLEDGSVAAVICDRVTAMLLISKDASGSPLVPLTSVPYVIVSRIRAAVLLERVNEALTAWQADGTIDAWMRELLAEVSISTL